MSKIAGVTVAVLVLTLGLMLAAGCIQPAATPTPAPTTLPPPQEPKRLEEKITIEMGDMFFATAQGVTGGLFKVSAGKTVGIKIVNKGAMEHEIMFGREVEFEEREVAGKKVSVPHGYKVPLFEDVDADIFVYPGGKKIEIETEGKFAEIEMEAGAPDVWIRTKFPAGVKGEWEIGCFVPGHYEAGMKAKFIIE